MNVLLYASPSREGKRAYPLEMSFASGLLASAGHRCLQLDGTLHGNDVFASSLRHFHPGLVVCFLRSSGMPEETGRFLRSSGPIPLVLAGACYSRDPMTHLRNENADYGIEGPCPGTMLLELVRDLEAHRHELPSLLQALPERQMTGPLYDSALLEFYSPSTRREIPLRTIRAGKRIPPETIFSSLHPVLHPGKREFFSRILDDCFNDPSGSETNFLDAVDDADFPFPFSANLNAGILKRSSLLKLLRSGLRQAVLCASFSGMEHDFPPAETLFAEYAPDLPLSARVDFSGTETPESLSQAGAFLNDLCSRMPAECRVPAGFPFAGELLRLAPQALLVPEESDL